MGVFCVSQQHVADSQWLAVVGASVAASKHLLVWSGGHWRSCLCQSLSTLRRPAQRPLLALHQIFVWEVRMCNRLVSAYCHYIAQVLWSNVMYVEHPRPLLCRRNKAVLYQITIDCHTFIVMLPLCCCRYVATPLGNVWGIRDRVRLKAERNPLLENYFCNQARTPSQVC